MKKTLVLASLLAAFGAASAQSSVTLFGKADVAIGESKAVFTNAAGVTTTDKLSGVAVTGLGNNSPRWGIRGSEALGNGLSANFHYEASVTTSDGTSANFARRSTVGLSGAFGAVDLGRALVPTIFVLGTTDADGINSFSTTSHATATLAQNAAVYIPGLTNSAYYRRNGLTYTSPNMSGFTVMAQYANTKRNNGAAGTTASSVDANGMGLSATYVAGPWYVGLAIDNNKTAAVNNAGGITTTNVNGAGAAAKHSATALGVNYNFGFAKLLANYSSAKVSDAATPVASTAYQSAKQFNLGVQVPFGATTFLASVGKNKMTDNTGFSGNGTDVMVGLNYQLSPRTQVYARAGTVDKVSFTSASGANAGSSKLSKALIGVQHDF
jgi:predicted porin